MMSDVPWGVLLSGGLDSSLVASVASRHISRKNPDFPKLHSFSVVAATLTNKKAAKEVSEYLNTTHHSYEYTIQEGLDAVRDVIKCLETYDVTTIRASTPMYLMARKIKAMGIKMVLSGEGADEVFGGYLYFHKAPNEREFHEETVDKLSRLYMYDCLRCNKSMSAWGVEPRVPFLDADFLNMSMCLDPKEKMINCGPDVPKEVSERSEASGYIHYLANHNHNHNHIGTQNKRIEKWAIRNAFDTPDDPYLPDHILWRQKEQFSDGVGYGWVDSLVDAANVAVTDQQMESAANRFPHGTPATKEAFRYRAIFEEFYPGEAAAKTVPGGKSIACSTERAIAWDAR